MKRNIFVLIAIFLPISFATKAVASWGCKNFSGTYIDENKTSMVISQQKCDFAKIEFSYEDEKWRSLKNLDLKLDGKEYLYPKGVRFLGEDVDLSISSSIDDRKLSLWIKFLGKYPHEVIVTYFFDHGTLKETFSDPPDYRYKANPTEKAWVPKK